MKYTALLLLVLFAASCGVNVNHPNKPRYLVFETYTNSHGFTNKKYVWDNDARLWGVLIVAHTNYRFFIPCHLSDMQKLYHLRMSCSNGGYDYSRGKK